MKRVLPQSGLSLFWLLVIGGGSLLGTLLVIGVLYWTGIEARDYVRKHFAEVRRNPAAYTGVGDAERREAYLAVAESEEEWVSPFSDWKGGGDFNGNGSGRHCISVMVDGRLGRMTLAVVVLVETKQSVVSMSVDAISARRNCTCGYKKEPCRLE